MPVEKQDEPEADAADDADVDEEPTDDEDLEDEADDVIPPKLDD